MEAEVYRSPEDVQSWLAGFLRRRWKLMVTVGALILALVVIYLLLATRIYVANSVVAMDPRRNTINEIGGAVLSAAPLTDDLIETEVIAIRSREIAAKVVAELDLANRAGFATPPSSSLKRWLRSIAYGKPASTTAVVDNQRQAVDRLLNNLDATRIGSSYAIRIGFSSADPDLAADVSNAVARTYVLDQKQQRDMAKTSANAELTASLESLRARLGAAERNLANARARAGMVDARAASGSDIALLQTQRASANADAALAAGRASSASVEQAVNNSPAIQSLRSQIGTIRAEREVARARYGAEHPSIASSLASEAAIAEQIERETAAIRRLVSEGLKAEADAQARRAASQSQSLARARAELANQISQTGSIAALATEVDSLRTLYDAELSRFKQVTGALEDQPSSKLVASAVPPQVPSKPNVKLMLGLGILLAAVGALAVAVLAELISGVREPKPDA